MNQEKYVYFALLGNQSVIIFEVVQLILTKFVHWATKNNPSIYLIIFADNFLSCFCLFTARIQYVRSFPFNHLFCRCTVKLPHGRWSCSIDKRLSLIHRSFNCCCFSCALSFLPHLPLVIRDQVTRDMFRALVYSFILLCREQPEELYQLCLFLRWYVTIELISNTEKVNPIHQIMGKNNHNMPYSWILLTT